MEPDARIEPQDWMTAPAVVEVVRALAARGSEVRFVGGCVRDALAGRPIQDIDIATPDRPETVIELLEAAGIKAVPTGVDHGTVTAVAHHRPIEITTLRVDVETYGRRAKVAFTDDWEADAARRDFTMNAMSCAPDGRLYDPFGGRGDLERRRVRFVGAARTRIEEDYLRLLRFFRFHAHYGAGQPDDEGLEAATALAGRLAGLAGERIRNELMKLLAAADPVPTLRIMIERDILKAVLPPLGGLDVLERLIGLEEERREPDPLRRLAVLMAQQGDHAAEVADRLRLSNAERERLIALDLPSEPVSIGFERAALRRALYRLGAGRVRDLLLIDWARADRSDRAALDRALAVAAEWTAPRFPLQGRDLLARGIAHGPRVGAILSQIEDWWISRDFQPSRADCLDQVERAVSE